MVALGLADLCLGLGYILEEYRNQLLMVKSLGFLSQEFQTRKIKERFALLRIRGKH